MIPSEIINVPAYQKQKGETLSHRPATSELVGVSVSVEQQGETSNLDGMLTICQRKR
jgi:hypothetical protein